MVEKMSSAAKYWKWYGGAAAVFRSRYFGMAIIVAILGYLISLLHSAWWDVFLSIIPNLLGFSIGAYALVIGLGNEKFLLIITGSSAKDKASASPFLSVSATFVHFIIVQTIAIFLLLASKALYVPMPSIVAKLINSSQTMLWSYCVGMHLLHFMAMLFSVYALFLVISASLHMLMMTSWIDTYFGSERAARMSAEQEKKNKLN